MTATDGGIGGPPGGGLGRHAISGAIIQILSRSARALVGVGTVVVLSRFLAPGEFGLFALIFFFVSFAQIINDNGVRAALVMRPQSSAQLLDSAFWTSLAVGLSLTLVTIACAEPAARLFREPALTAPLRQSAWVFLFNSLGSVPLAVMERQFRFNRIAQIEITAAIIGALVAVAFAYAGKGVLALVAQQLVMAALPALMNLALSRYQPRLRFSLAEIRSLSGTSSRATLAGMLQFLASNIDRPIAGARLAAADLGLLAIAQQVVSTPPRIIVANVRRVTFPIIASIQTEDGRILAAHTSSLHAVMLALAPTCCGLAALAEPTARVLLGPQWAGAGPVMAVAALTALVTSVGQLNLGIFASRGKTDYLLRWSIGALITNVILLWTLAGYGLMAIMLGRLAYTLVALPLGAFLLSRELQCRISVLLFSFARPLAAACLMGLTVFAFDQLWLRGLASPLLRLLVLAPAGVLIYAGAIWLLDRAMLLTLLARVKSARTPRAGGAS